MGCYYDNKEFEAKGKTAEITCSVRVLFWLRKHILMQIPQDVMCTLAYFVFEHLMP